MLRNFLNKGFTPFFGQTIPLRMLSVAQTAAKINPVPISTSETRQIIRRPNIFRPDTEET